MKYNIHKLTVKKLKHLLEIAVKYTVKRNHLIINKYKRKPKI